MILKNGYLNKKVLIVCYSQIKNNITGSITKDNTAVVVEIIA